MTEPPARRPSADAATRQSSRLARPLRSGQISARAQTGGNGMDDEFAPRPVAGWYLPAAIASLLFMGLGCIAYLMTVLADPSDMPLETQTALEAMPAWVTGAQAVAVWIGLAGTVLLIMRRKLAEPLLMVSLAAVLVWL